MINCGWVRPLDPPRVAWSGPKQSGTSRPKTGGCCRRLEGAVESMELITLLLVLGFVILTIATAVALEEGLERTARGDREQAVRDDPA